MYRQTHAHWVETSLTKKIDRLVIDPFDCILLATVRVNKRARSDSKIGWKEDLMD